MKVILTKKMADEWSRADLYQGCNHYLGSYYKRSGQRYVGDFNDRDKERFEKALGENLDDKVKNNDGEMVANPFWTNYTIKLDSKNKLVFHTENIKEEFDVAFLEKHKDIAMGYTDKKPGTKYILIKEQDEAEVVNKKAQIKIRAIVEYGKLTPEQMRKVLRLYGHNPNNVTNEVVQSTLYQLVERDPDEFIRIWVDNADKEIQFLIEEAVANNVVRNTKTIYKYGTDVIGYTLEEAIEYLKNPSNGNVRLAILARIEGKKEIEAPSEERTVKSQFKQLLEEIEEEPSKEIENAKEDTDTNILGESEKVEQIATENKKASKKVPTSSKKAK